MSVQQPSGQMNADVVPFFAFKEMPHLPMPVGADEPESGTTEQQLWIYRY